MLIPVFPGTNCEYDTMRAAEKAGLETEIFIIKNLNSADVAESITEFAKRIESSQIIFIPGGFSGGDEPDGSGKFITAFFRNPLITEKVRELLKIRDGLMCGICNGFQALIKLGLVPFGDILEADASFPTLTFNTIGRHQSMIVRTVIASTTRLGLRYQCRQHYSVLSPEAGLSAPTVINDANRYTQYGPTVAYLRRKV